jgi:cytochrome b subunit of formate dehydrogenase
VLLGARTPAQDNAKCLECHSTPGLAMERDGHTVSLSVDLERFAKSVHGQLDCVACHLDLAGVEEYPHAKGLERVSCTECHDDDDGPVQAWRDSAHGKLAEAGDARAPLCQDCHGGHEMQRLKEPGSATSPFHVATMCNQCHAEGAPVERAFGLSEAELRARYRDRIHGDGLHAKGLTVTADCTSCHGGHAVLPPDDPRSSLHRENLSQTCGACHGELEQVHSRVIASELWTREGAVPLCVDCHAPHSDRHVFYATGLADADCLGCHTTPLSATGDGRSLQVDPAEHTRSIHGRSGIACAQCHAGAAPAPAGQRSCATITERVECGTCHPGAVTDHARSIHGQLLARGDRNAPSCTECHGTHGILEHRLPSEAASELAALVRGSPTYRRNVLDLCARCHRDGAVAAERYLGPESDIVGRYSVSIHGKALLESGLVVTAVCSDCHGTHGELPASDPDSSVHPGKIAGTCGQCHDGINETFRTSIHSPEGNPDYVQTRGKPELPDCNDCHSSHGMGRTDADEFKLGVIEQCGGCHADITQTYFETYHGKAAALGDATRAKCNDCHGAHDILPASHPGSHLSEANIVQTCASCHPGAHPQFTTYLPHASHRDREGYPALYWTFVAMTTLLLSVFGFFGLHTLAWLPHSLRLRREIRARAQEVGLEAKHFQRFTAYQRGLHAVMILSFFGLAITGMMLKFSYMRWAAVLAHLMGGIEVAGRIHRVCAIVTFGYMTLHLVDVAKRFRASKTSVWQFLNGPDSLMPKWSDVQEFWATMRWFFGRGPQPRYGRWTYWEKFDYLAVFWGVVVIGSTGMVLWFPELFTRVLPGWSINVATIIHSDEALLATGFIFTIHFFNTHFRPEKFPMDPVIFSGSVQVGELRHERPEQYERLMKSGELEKYLVDPPDPQFMRAARIFGFAAVTVGLALVVLIAWAMLSGH